jgi:hypothetical protein
MEFHVDPIIESVLAAALYAGKKVAESTAEDMGKDLWRNAKAVWSAFVSEAKLTTLPGTAEAMNELAAKMHADPGLAQRLASKIPPDIKSHSAPLVSQIVGDKSVVAVTLNVHGDFKM